MEKFIAYSVGICYMSVCVEKDLQVEEIEQKANVEYPSGVKPWQLADENFRTGEPNPLICDKYPIDRLHYLLNC